MLSKKSKKQSKFRRIKNLIRKMNPISSNAYSRRINRIGQRNKFEVSTYVGVQSATHVQMNERNPKAVFERTVYLPFEDTLFPCPSGYDEYLKHLYGDYMKLPPESQRVASHINKFYLLDE